MDGAKDPDEYIIKYGNARFQTLIDKALSVIEFKVKILKQNLNLDITNDKIKFLNEKFTFLRITLAAFMLVKKKIMK